MKDTTPPTRSPIMSTTSRPHLLRTCWLPALCAGVGGALGWAGSDMVYWWWYVYYFDGLKLFGSECADLLPDDLHPNAEGYKILGHNFLRQIAVPLFHK